MLVHGNSDTSGAARAVESIATGMGWRAAHAPAVVLGPPGKQDLETCWELGATVAATLA